MPNTCYDNPRTLIATGCQMAAQDGYEVKPHDWGKIHPDWRARRVIESTWILCCIERAEGSDPTLLTGARHRLEESLRNFGGPTVDLKFPLTLS